MNNNWHKKEKPLLGLTGLGGGVDGLAVVGAASKPYVDDVFSTYLYTGDSSARSFSTGTDMSKGGFTFIKSRSNTLNGNIFSSDLVNRSGVFGCLQTTDTDAAGYSNTQLREKVNIVAGKLSDNQTINIDNGMVHYFTTTETTTATPNIMSTVGINTQMGTGDTIAVTLVTTAAAGAYCANIQVDGAAVTENWIGGSAPSDGGSSGVDIHTFTIIKTASATFTVIGNQSKTS